MNHNMNDGVNNNAIIDNATINNATTNSSASNAVDAQMDNNQFANTQATHMQPPPYPANNQINNNSQINDNNPYQVPTTMDELDYQDYEENDSTWYHLSGRIGRLRYMTYHMIIIPFAMIIGVLSALLIAGSEGNSDLFLYVLLGVGALFGIPFAVYSYFIYPIRRLNDLNLSGWFCLIGFIPYINILFYLALILVKGTEGVNNYGSPPRPNRAIHYTGIVLFLIIPIIGILAAIAIPAYQDYVQRSQEASMQMAE